MSKIQSWLKRPKNILLSIYLILLPIVFYVCIQNIFLVVAFVIPVYCLFCSTQNCEMRCSIILDYLIIHCVFFLYLFLIVIWYVCFSEPIVSQRVVLCILILLTIVVTITTIVTCYRLRKWHITMYCMLPLLVLIFIGYGRIVAKIFLCY
jgi:hypothetical protein